jgi:hypothetical protein
MDDERAYLEAETSLQERMKRVYRVVMEHGVERRRRD